MILQIKFLVHQESRKKYKTQLFANIPANGYFMESFIFYILFQNTSLHFYMLNAYFITEKNSYMKLKKEFIKWH